MMKNKATAMQNNKIKVTMNNNNYNRKVDKPKINSKIKQNNCPIPITKNKFLIKMKAMTKRLLIKMMPMTNNRFLIKMKTITKLRILTRNQNKPKSKQEMSRKNTPKITKPTQATSKTTQARLPNLHHQATNHHLYSQTKITHQMNNHNTLINNQINIMMKMMMKMMKKIRKKFKIMRMMKGKIVNILKGSLRERRMIMGMFHWNWIDSYWGIRSHVICLLFMLIHMHFV